MSLFGVDKLFYYNNIRKYIVCFASLFDDMYIQRKDNQAIKVALKYGSGYLYANANQSVEQREEQKTALILPAISLYISDIKQNKERHTNRWQQLTNQQINQDDSINISFNRTPYDINFTLIVRTKNTEDQLMISEQIISVFDPSVTIQINELDSTQIEINQEVPIFLESLNINDNYQEYEKQRVIEWEFSFRLEGYIYKRIQKEDIIKTVNYNISQYKNELTPFFHVDSYELENVERSNITLDNVINNGLNSIDINKEINIINSIFDTES